MPTIGDFSDRDHRDCDDLLPSAEAAMGQNNRDRARSLLGRFQAAMAPDLAMEETMPFPAFEARSGMQSWPTEAMRTEHDQMRGLLQKMAVAVTQADQDRYLGLSETLNMLMQQHKLKEENLLYLISEQVLGAERDSVIRAMEAVAWS